MIVEMDDILSMVKGRARFVLKLHSINFIRWIGYLPLMGMLLRSIQRQWPRIVKEYDQAEIRRLMIFIGMDYVKKSKAFFPFSRYTNIKNALAPFVKHQRESEDVEGICKNAIALAKEGVNNFYDVFVLFLVRCEIVKRVEMEVSDRNPTINIIVIDLKIMYNNPKLFDGFFSKNVWARPFKPYTTNYPMYVQMKMSKHKKSMVIQYHQSYGNLYAHFMDEFFIVKPKKDINDLIRAITKNRS